MDFYNFQKNSLHELRELALSAGAEIVGECLAKRDRPDPKFSIGEGKVEELKLMVQAHDADLVIFNYDLTPSQERNLEEHVGVRILDRTGLILDIFARRARTFEGKLQVELAQIQYMSSRLKRAWTHLERQRGGAIGLTGPGETQLELDKRLLQGKVKQLKKRLEKVKQTRSLSRQARQKSETPTVSLVGYTNAGKSSLFNVLTGEHVYVQNQLFATLDPTLRRCRVPRISKLPPLCPSGETPSGLSLPSGERRDLESENPELIDLNLIDSDLVQERYENLYKNNKYEYGYGLDAGSAGDARETQSIVLADTVGFIRNLPHSLVKAFSATLEETVLANVLLHVVDAADPDKELLIGAVNEVLGELKVLEKPMIQVFNKIDLLDPPIEPRIDRDESGKAIRVWISCERRLGLDLLLAALSEYLP